MFAWKLSCPQIFLLSFLSDMIPMSRFYPGKVSQPLSGDHVVMCAIIRKCPSGWNLAAMASPPSPIFDHEETTQAIGGRSLGSRPCICCN